MCNAHTLTRTHGASEFLATIFTVSDASKFVFGAFCFLFSDGLPVINRWRRSLGAVHGAARPVPAASRSATLTAPLIRNS